MAKKKEFKHYADGERLQPIVLETKVRSMDEIFGMENAPFPTLNAAEYQRQLKEKSIIDLRRECVERGVYPKDSIERMITALMREHSNYITKLAASQTKVKQAPKLSKTGKDILAEGANKPR